MVSAINVKLETCYDMPEKVNYVDIIDAYWTVRLDEGETQKTTSFPNVGTYCVINQVFTLEYNSERFLHIELWDKGTTDTKVARGKLKLTSAVLSSGYRGVLVLDNTRGLECGLNLVVACA